VLTCYVREHAAPSFPVRGIKTMRRAMDETYRHSALCWLCQVLSVANDCTRFVHVCRFMSLPHYRGRFAHVYRPLAD